MGLSLWNKMGLPGAGGCSTGVQTLRPSHAGVQAQLTHSQHSNRVKSDSRDLGNLSSGWPKVRAWIEVATKESSPHPSLLAGTPGHDTFSGLPRVTQLTSSRARREARVSGFPGPVARAQPHPRAPSARCVLSNCLSSVLFLLPCPWEAMLRCSHQPEAVSAPQTGKLTSVPLLVLPLSLLCPPRL